MNIKRVNQSQSGLHAFFEWKRNNINNKDYKRLILSLFVVLLGALAAMGQIKTSPSYSDIYEKDSGKLRAKEWIMPDKMRVESFDPNGKCSIMIYRLDSAKVYTQIGDGSWMAMPLSRI